MGDVMRVATAGSAPWETAARVAGAESSANRRRNGSRFAADIEHGPIGSLSHLDERRVARQPPRRFRGNVDTAVGELEDSLERRVAGRVVLDVQHDLVTVGRRAAVET